MKHFLSKERFKKFGFPVGLAVGSLIAFVAALYGFVQWTNYHADNTEIREALKASDPDLQLAAVSLANLKAQQEMAEWSYALYWVGFVSLVASVAGIGLVLMNLLALNEQNRMARHFGEAQTQPYLTIGTPAVFRQTGIVNGLSGNRKCELQIELINSGATPATDVQVFFAFYFTTEFHELNQMEEPIVQFERLDLAPLAASGSTLLASEFTVSNDAMLIGPEMREANCEIVFAVLVLYRDVSSQKNHELCVEVSTSDTMILNRGFRRLELRSARAKRTFITPEAHAAILWEYSDPDRPLA